LLGATATPTGANVAITPTSSASVTFDAVTAGGETCIETITSFQYSNPIGYRFGQSHNMIDITTSALYSGNATVCMGYDQSRLRGSETLLRLFHWNGTAWNDITNDLDTAGNVICGFTNSLSPFAIGEEVATAIDLKSFSGSVENGKVTLVWETFSEIDNAGFQIMRSDYPTRLPSDIDKYLNAKGSLKHIPEWQLRSIDKIAAG